VASTICDLASAPLFLTAAAECRRSDQNQPLRAEIKGFKTGHYLEAKTVVVGLVTAGAEGHLDCTKSEPGSDDIRFSRSRMVSAPDGNPNLGRTERLLPILGIKETAKTSHSAPGFEWSAESNPPF
jgi:hypothetical protein